MSRTQRSLVLSCILIIAIFFRFYHFTSTPPGLYPDEAMDGNNAVAAAETNHYQPFYAEDNGREGLYVNIIAMFEKIHAVYEPWIVRLPAAIAGVLTVWGIYLLAAELFGTSAGLLASFLLATSVWDIIFSRIGFRAILAPLLLTWAFYFLIKAFKENSSRKALWLAVAAGAVYGLGFYTYIAYRITPLLFLLFIPFHRTDRKFWKRIAVFLLMTCIVAAPLAWYFIEHPGDFFGRTAQISVANAANPLHDLVVNIGKTALMFDLHGDYNWRQNISGAPELFFPVGLLFILGITLSAYMLSRRGRRKHITAENDALFPAFGTLLTFGWLIFGGLPAALSNEGIPHALRSILMVPPAMIFAAQGGIWFYRFIARYWGRIAAIDIAVIFVIAVSVFAYYDYFVTWAQNPNVPAAFNQNYVDIGRQINALPSSTPKYVIVNASGGVLSHGIPIPAQTAMFLTHSFTEEDQRAAHIRYLLPTQVNQIPKGTPTSTIFYIN